MIEYLSFLRIVSYIVVMLTSIFMVKFSCKKLVHFSNIIMASALMTNLILVYIDLDKSNDMVGFAIINISVFIWGMLHFAEFISNRNC